MEQINVDGTENVLGLAVELSVPKIIYTSTVAVLGDTFSRVVDETHHRDCPFESAYDRTKYQAHQVAQLFPIGLDRARGSPLRPGSYAQQFDRFRKQHGCIKAS